MRSEIDQTQSIPTSDDAFIGGRLRLLQPRQGYRAGIDAVLLAAAVRPGRGSRRLRVLDLGAGVGAAGLCVARRLRSAEVTLLEREEPLAALALANVRRNDLSDRATVVHGDLTGAGADHDDAALVEHGFDRLIANPPYHTDGRGTSASSGLKARAHAMAAGQLDEWSKAMVRFAAPGAVVTVIHKAEGLPELVAALQRRFGGLIVLPLHPRAGAPAIRVIVEATRGSRAPLRLLSGLVLHRDGHAFTDWASGVLAEGSGIDMARLADPAAEADAQ